MKKNVDVIEKLTPADLMSCMHKFNKELKGVENRVNHIENKMGEFVTTFNDLVDDSEGKDEEMEWVKAKIADIENRSIRNNLKIRGIPESVAQADLCSYVTVMFKAILPETSNLDVTVDRVHCIPKPSQLTDQITRDVILPLHVFTLRRSSCLQCVGETLIHSQYLGLQFYADLSQYTLMKRKKLNTLTKALRNHDISYRWGYPTKITVRKDASAYVIYSLEKGLSLLKTWQILPDESAPPSSARNAKHVDPEWKMMTKNFWKHT